MGLGSLLDRLRGGSGPSEAEAEVNRFAEGSLPADVYITTIGVHDSYLMRYLHTQRTISASFTFSYTVCISWHSNTAGPRQGHSSDDSHSNIHDESICALALCFVNPAFVCQ